MKSLIKYQIVLLLTVIAGYSQLFALLTTYDEFAKLATSEQVKSQVLSLLVSDILYFEEEREGEDNWQSKGQTELAHCGSFFNSSTWGFSPGLQISSIVGKTIRYPASVHPVYRALRL